MKRFRFCCFLGLFLFSFRLSLAESPENTVVRIEEDWKIIIKSPDPNSAGPQITTALSPTANLNQLHATFELNHQTLPTVSEGGMQLQLWNGPWDIVSEKYPHNQKLNREQETVCWTQAMDLSGGKLTFEVINGSSTTWGSFGGQDHLRSQASTSLSDLNEYHPQISIQHSGVGFGKSRVDEFSLVRVRIYTADGEVHEDETIRDVQ